MKLDVPIIVSFDLLALEPEQIYRHAEKILAQSTHNVCVSLQRFCDELVAKKLLGVVERHPKKLSVGRLTFHRHCIRQKQLSKRESKQSKSREEYTSDKEKNHWETVKETTTSTTTERDMQRTRSQSEHTHIGYGLDRHAWPGSTIRKPKWAEDFIASVPNSFRPYVDLYTMQMCNETIVEKDIGTKKWTDVSKDVQVARTIIAEGKLNDPAVLLFETYVLCGWSDRDLEGR